MYSYYINLGDQRLTLQPIQGISYEPSHSLYKESQWQKNNFKQFYQRNSLLKSIKFLKSNKLKRRFYNNKYTFYYIYIIVKECQLSLYIKKILFTNI